jgi:hypothetical protein
VQVGRKVVHVKVKSQITFLDLLAKQFSLNVQFRCKRPLREEIVDVLLDISVFAEAVSFGMELASTDGKAVINSRGNGFVGERIIAADLARNIELRLVALEQRGELVEAGPGRPSAGEDAEVGFAQAWLDRIDVDVLSACKSSLTRAISRRGWVK